jgi:tetratricopeptide (TPR) repeat protein
LTKENALLKASAAEEKNGTASGKESNTVAQAQAALASANQKLGEQTDRVNKLAAENKTLQARVQSLMTSPSATDALQQENEVLQKQLAGLQSSATNSATNNTELNSELADARAQITTLKYAAGVSKLENEALENRIRQLQTQTSSVAATPAPGQADNEEKIRALTQERDDLLAKLGDANKELYGRKKQGAAARIDALTDQVNTLRARIAVDEAQAVPYTPAELALFKQSAPQMAGPDSDQKSISELPSGSAELAAAAQNYFSAGQYEKAGEDYQKILQRDEHNGLALANLATIELQENKLADAEKHIKAALAESPDDSYNLATLGKIEFAQGKYDDALNALSRAAKLDPNNPEIENYLGVTLGHKGLRAQAETALRKAVQLDPNYGAAHNNLAVIYLSQNPPLVELARWHYQKALADGQPRNPALEKMLAAKGAPVDSQSADQQENNN